MNEIPPNFIFLKRRTSIIGMNPINIVKKGGNNLISNWSAILNMQLKYMYALTNRLTPRQFNFEPEPDKWSVGACIEHLNISMGAYLDIMEPTVKKTNRKSNETYTGGTLMGRLLLRALQQPGWHFPAPRSFLPENNELKPSRIRDVFEKQISRLQLILEDCYGLAIGKIKISWPVFRPVKISLAQAIELQVLHNDRHLKQAERVIQNKNFPIVE